MIVFIIALSRVSSKFQVVTRIVLIFLTNSLTPAILAGSFKSDGPLKVLQCDCSVDVH